MNRLTSVRYRVGAVDSIMARYAYDVVGRRIAKRVYSSTSGGIFAYTRFVYRGSAVGFETDSAGTTIGLRYTHGRGVDDLVAIRDASGNHYYVVTDLIGSVRGLVKRDGTWQRSLRYRPYGSVVTDTAAASAPTWELRYRWTGREYDSETGWYYFRARYFDPNVRRFVQEDPIGYAGGMNVYAYGNGSPLEGRDPSGMVMNYERMQCNICGRIEDQDEVYIDGAPAGGGFDLSSSAFTYNAANPWADVDAIRARAAAQQRALLAAAEGIAAAAEELAASVGNITIGQTSVGPVEIGDDKWHPRNGDIFAVGYQENKFINEEGQFRLTARFTTDIYRGVLRPPLPSYYYLAEIFVHVRIDLFETTPTRGVYTGLMEVRATKRWYDVYTTVNARGYAWFTVLSEHF